MKRRNFIQRVWGWLAALPMVPFLGRKQELEIKSLPYAHLKTVNRWMKAEHLIYEMVVRFRLSHSDWNRTFHGVPNQPSVIVSSWTWWNGDKVVHQDFVFDILSVHEILENDGEFAAEQHIYNGFHRQWPKGEKISSLVSIDTPLHRKAIWGEDA